MFQSNPSLTQGLPTHPRTRYAQFTGNKLKHNPFNSSTGEFHFNVLAGR